MWLRGCEEGVFSNNMFSSSIQTALPLFDSSFRFFLFCCWCSRRCGVGVGM